VPRRWRLVAQLLVTAVVLALVARTVASQLVQLPLSRVRAGGPARLAAAVARQPVRRIGLQIESWRRILRGWAQSLRFVAGARIWFLANLGRYVPGKVWSVAGMVVLASRRAVQRWAAAASAVAVQAIGIGTAAALVAAATPHAASPVRLAAAVLVGGCHRRAAGVEGSARLARPAVGRINRVARASRRSRAGRLRPHAAQLVRVRIRLLGPRPWARAATRAGRSRTLRACSLSATFWASWRCLRRAASAFAKRVLRALTPYLGSGGALALSVASRLELTVTEAVAGLGALALGRRKGRETLDPRS